METEQETFEEIARLIMQGNTSGIIDHDGERTVWELSIKQFSTDEAALTKK